MPGVLTRDVEAVIFRPPSIPLPPTKSEKTTVDNFLNFCGSSLPSTVYHFEGKNPFIAITLFTSLELIVPNYSVFLLFRY